MDAHSKLKPTLEDYILEMETRPPDSGQVTEKDVWAQLHQKEADLLLAAELGKALLEKNEELKKNQEKLIDDYSAKVENLEQEKYILKRQLEISSSENEAIILELQGDIKQFRQKLEAQEQIMRQMEREKNMLIEELTAQNTRLSNELQKSNATEQQLTAQLQEIKEQCNRRTLSIQDHVSSLESLKNELRLILEKKNELENRLHMTVNERENLSIALNEASERIHILERSTKEQDTKYQMTVQTLDRLERENGTLSERLESFDSQRSLHGELQHHSSLLQEMNGEEECAGSKDEASQLVLKEAQSVYKQLKTLCQTLRSTHHDDDSGLHSDMSFSSLDNTMAPVSMATPSSVTEATSASMTVNDKFSRGMLSAVADELVHTIMNLDAMQFKTMFEQTRSMLIEQEEELKKKNDVIMQLESKLSVREVELQSTIEERNQAREDASHSSLAQDETVVQARKDRDAAIERRTKAEVELAKNRVELMQANSQLLEAIQQKVELLQQLEQWQIDMHELIEEQMKNKLIESSTKPQQHQQQSQQSSGASTTGSRKSRLLDLFYHR
ncbi:bicaudal D-related protein homolog isoform X1 [Anopheles merus]|uniref:bicaudal D-related protein homolog isoform X2 n=1 Tax=Anopheles merus TaxID=30066 RepID=UPI0007D5479B|nr:bicaudal D-related protein homolog isoform X2 [Anopheles merus]XP_041761243.1 bicaudal D-related protein homolog isoform X2 [Anopheles merus]XP_041761244.1 bicaudal D-related protein homolog isoform X2 [Anopheles merus]XP_041787399.1 bicaudal D-related protein homolog isoform X1 [Anopheles merus]XP_041787400.1 bicaudal D-related protein homolog isoform X1 [Anopheles merus]XP_041787401.1 bicaudal D-related protein homolog isoform X1 [Anopheles merus]